MYPAMSAGLAFLVGMRVLYPLHKERILSLGNPQSGPTLERSPQLELTYNGACRSQLTVTLPADPF